MSLWTLLQASLMAANSFAILHNDRFLERYGWGYSSLYEKGYGAAEPGTIKRSITGFLHACSYMRLPLIILNVIVV
eukprot:CAMPEP_0117680838 /NCGR_PEP_ID=MMETSP0804-20121206/18597_1 /TAXON_ID=1074897 /ORGANISM="Tetraselmis astigmatica, Strain CCMP880" /LENGTH=75 /DNA_ID=CAMNT_0005490425 /DNA_START=301 /DNA_END=525 /DNA_ORIENTATION=-